MSPFTTPFAASKRFLGSVSAAALLLGFAPVAAAQVVVNDARTAPVETDGEDVTIESGGSITLENAGPALVLNSDNDVAMDGAITIEDINVMTACPTAPSPKGVAAQVFLSLARHLLRAILNSPQAQPSMSKARIVLV